MHAASSSKEAWTSKGQTRSSHHHKQHRVVRQEHLTTQRGTGRECDRWGPAQPEHRATSAAIRPSRHTGNEPEGIFDGAFISRLFRSEIHLAYAPSYCRSDNRELERRAFFAPTHHVRDERRITSPSGFPCNVETVLGCLIKRT